MVQTEVVCDVFTTGLGHASFVWRDGHILPGTSSLSSAADIQMSPPVIRTSPVRQTRAKSTHPVLSYDNQTGPPGLISAVCMEVAFVRL